MSVKSFTFVKFLGKGSFGSVHQVRRNADGKIYALKEINIKTMSQREREDAMNEIRILASFKHQNIIRYREAFVEGDKLYIITEFAEDGDLLNKIKTARTARRYFSEDVIWIYFIQMCRAISFLHKQNVLHRDIKSANVFLSTGRVVKFGDLGVAKLLDGPDKLTRTSIGTPYYISPEIWQNKPYNARSDCWSLGCVLYELLTLTRPFEGNSMAALSRAARAGKYAPLPPIYSKELKDIVTGLLQVDPMRRPTVEEILALPIMSEKKQQLRVDTLQDRVTTHTPMKAPPSFHLRSTIKIPREMTNMKRMLKLPASMYSDSTATPPPPLPSGSAGGSTAHAPLATAGSSSVTSSHHPPSSSSSSTSAPTSSSSVPSSSHPPTSVPSSHSSVGAAEPRRPPPLSFAAPPPTTSSSVSGSVTPSAAGSEAARPPLSARSASSRSSQSSVGARPTSSSSSSAAPHSARQQSGSSVTPSAPALPPTSRSTSTTTGSRRVPSVPLSSGRSVTPSAAAPHTSSSGASSSRGSGRITDRPVSARQPSSLLRPVRISRAPATASSSGSSAAAPSKLTGSSSSSSVTPSTASVPSIPPLRVSYASSSSSSSSSASSSRSSARGVSSSLYPGAPARRSVLGPAAAPPTTAPSRFAAPPTRSSAVPTPTPPTVGSMGGEGIPA